MSFAFHSRPRDDEAPTLAPPEQQLDLKPGAVLELAAIETSLDNARLALADLKAAKGDYARFEAQAHRLAALAKHFADSVTNQRPRPPQRPKE